MELISALIPTYNRAHMIGKAVKSLLEQTYSNLQIIIVDDGSTDNTREVINQLEDSRIDYHKIDHVGVSGASNYGLSKAQSNVIIRLGSDDYCHPNRIQIQYSFYKDSRGQYGVIGSNFYVFDMNKNLLLKTVFPKVHKQIIEQLPRKCCLADPTVLYRKDIIQEIGGYNQNKSAAEDWDLFLRLINKTKFYNIQKFLVTIRKHNHNLSAPSDTFNKENMEVPVKYFEKTISKEKNNKKIAKAYFDMGYIYYYENQLDKSIGLFEEAVKREPFSLQYLRYFIPNKYFYNLIQYSRKYNFYKYLNFFRKLDKNNYFFRNSF
jgi:glycosyltransferase involved in cell wall biosynthesis